MAFARIPFDEPLAERLAPPLEELLFDAPPLDELLFEAPFLDELLFEAPLLGELLFEAPLLDELLFEAPLLDELLFEAPLLDELLFEAPLLDESLFEAPPLDELLFEAPFLDELLFDVELFDPPVLLAAGFDFDEAELPEAFDLDVDVFFFAVVDDEDLLFVDDAGFLFAAVLPAVDLDLVVGIVSPPVCSDIVAVLRAHVCIRGDIAATLTSREIRAIMRVVLL